MIVYLVRHAHPVPPGTLGHEENERPLSERGRVDAERLAVEFDGTTPSALYSSPYPRARQTIEPLARRFNLAIKTLADLRERLLSSEPLPNWHEHLSRSWSDFDYALASGESNRDAQRRILVVLDQIRARHSNDDVAIVASHGNLIALALNAFDQSVDFNFWESIPLPAVFELEHTNAGWRIASGRNR